MSYQHEYVDESTLWDRIYQSDHENYVMCCSVGSEDYQGEHNQKGLATNHAYTLIGAYYTGGQRLVKIRNPWGQFEWHGDWSDQYHGWTDEMKEEVGWSDANDGIFFMSLSDFKNEFGTTTICSCHDDWEYEWIDCERNSDGHLNKFEVGSSCRVMITLSQ